MSSNAILDTTGPRQGKRIKRCTRVWELTSRVAYLVFMAGALAVLGETLQSLVDKGHVLLIDVQSQETQTARRAATDAV